MVTRVSSYAQLAGRRPHLFMAGTLRSTAAAGTDPGSGAPGRCDPERDAHGLVGRVVDDRYFVEEVVGRGGFGVVYRASHVHFESSIALKVMRVPGQLAGESRAAFVDRFLTEGKLLFRLSALHGAIVRVFEAGLVLDRSGHPTPYLALEWLDGHTLERELELRRASGRGCHTLDEVLALLGPIAAGLAAAHAERVAHRDIKPANIFLAEGASGRSVKLLDFGLAKAMSELTSSSHLYTESTFEERAFTPAYAAPEQWLRRLGATGPWSDVFALALVAVELCAGRRPLEGQDSGQMMAACLDAALRPTPRALGVQVSDEVEAVFARALAVEPRTRFRDAGSFWAALESARQVQKPRRGLWLAGGIAVALAGVATASLPDAKSAARVRPEPRPSVVHATIAEPSTASIAEPSEPPASITPTPNTPTRTRPRTRTRTPTMPSTSALPESGTGAPALNARADEMLHHDELAHRK